MPGPRAFIPGNWSHLEQIINELFARTVPAVVSDITTVVSDLKIVSDALSTEVSDRASAITFLSDALSTEVSDRTSAIKYLSDSLVTVSDALSGVVVGSASDIAYLSDALVLVSDGLSTEISDRASAEKFLSDEVLAVSDALSTEVSDRASAITFLSDALSTEVSDRASAIKFVSDSLVTVSNELSDTNSDIKFYSDALSTEISDRASAIKYISDALSTEVSDRKSAIKFLSDALSDAVSDIAFIESEIQLLDSFNGTFLETIDFTVSEAGGTVTGSLEQDGGGDLTQRFSDGFSTLDCTAPQCTINLTAFVGTDAVPTEAFVYILQSGKTTLVASNSDWPATEHIKVANLVLKSAATTGTDGGALVNRNWNDHAQAGTGQGHITHIEERLRHEHAVYHSGGALTIKDSGGNNLTTGNSDTAIELVIAETEVFQLHRHTFPAFDMYTTATDDVHITNQPTDEGGAYVTTADLVTDVTHYVDGTAAGVAIGANKYFNLVIWGIQNRSGEASHVMINLPIGQYTNSTDAVSDIEGTSVFTIPAEFNGTGFLLARLTMQMKPGAQWEYVALEDLRGQFPATSAGVGVSTTDHSLLANLIAPADDHTQYLLADGTRALAGAWDMGSQALTNVNIDSGVITGITDLAVADGGTGSSTAGDARTALGVAIGSDVLAFDTGLSNLAGVAMAADKFYYTSADNVHVAADVTAFARTILDDVNEATFKATVNLEIGTDVLAQQTIGIADNNLLEVDGSPNSGEYARFTANGLEGLTTAETLADLSGDATAAFSWNSQNLTSVGTIGSGTITSTGNLVIADAGTIGSTSATGALSIGAGGDVGVGLAAAQCTLDILIDNDASGGIRMQDTLTDATNKNFRFKVGHYTNAEEPVTIMQGISDSGTANILKIGGGSGLENAMTELQFYTAANDTTVTGTQRMTIAADGAVGIGATVPSEMLEVEGSDALVVRIQVSNTADPVKPAGVVMKNIAQRWAFTVDEASKWVVRDVDGANNVFSVEAGAPENSFYIDSGGYTGLGIVNPLGKLHVNQSSNSAAVPALVMRQADVDEPFIAFTGVAASAGLTRSIVDNGDVTTATLAGWLKVEVTDLGNQITDQAYFQPLYTLA